MNPTFRRDDEETLARHEAAGFDDAAAAAPAGLSRRSILRGGLKAAGGAALAATFQSFLGRAAFGQEGGPGYGPLRDVIDPATGLPLLRLPEGFRYVSFGWTGDSLNSGARTPSLHDGMAAIPVDNNYVVLIRNHEQGSGPAFRAPTYDPAAAGGTSNVLFNLATGVAEKSWASLSGTIRNCAGGPTPWGTWLTCEENFTNEGVNGATKSHGWNFEIPPFGAANPTPLRDMGRFVHEAIAIDPATGIVYETEDAGSSGFYRFLPNVPGVLRQGGRLEMLKIGGVNQADLRGLLPNNAIYPVEWVPIPNPALDGIVNPASDAVFLQGFSRGGARFSRLEGAWYGNGFIYFVATSGGGAGQVFEFDPVNQLLRVILQSPDNATLDNPDNLAVSPRSGGLIVCEDGGNPVQKLQALSTDGRIAPFAENNVVIPSVNNPKPLIAPRSYREFEWAGSTFAPGGPDGQWLFANIQTPGITFAITGPWARGGL